jgi:phage terminase large subunit-like protein
MKGQTKEVKPLGFKNGYCDLEPTAKQQKFLDCREELEVFFGGAAGGGKSVALLMGALEYVKVPGYAALILRKDYARLELAGGLIPRSHEWFGGKSAKWVANRRQWIFPIKGTCPATIMFGYLKNPGDKYRYASSEFQYIAFDELTEFAEEDYLFLFSRLRRNTSLKVPLRMRSASNPGGTGHLWVKQRFIPERSEEGGVQGPKSKVQGQEAEDGSQTSGEEGLVDLDDWEPGKDAFWKQGRVYIPSRIADNPALDEAEYRQTLVHLPALARERLMNGDWSVQEQGQIQEAWLRYYTIDRGQLELLAADGRTIAVVPDGSCRRLVTIDPAGTSAERTREARGRAPSWTVVQVWDQPRRELSKFLILRHQVRVRVGFDGLCKTICKVVKEWEPERVWIEGEKLGQAAQDQLKGEVELDLVRPGTDDKVGRAAELIMKLERGEVFLPKHENSWRPQFEAELLAWTGDEGQVADQIDAAAYAAIVVRGRTPERIKIGPATIRS